LRILLTGRGGQVGWELERMLPALGEVIATDLETLDLADPGAIRRAVREARPDVIANAAAYTAVDRAESEPELAMQINGVAPGVLAEEAKRAGALLLHYSTDYVFDGTKTTPYTEEDTPNPLNVYGQSKVEGERAIIASGCRHLIFRTSWVYGPRGRNFLLAILKAAREKSELRVVDDQVGAPTSSSDLADATVRALQAGGPEGLYHMSAAGRTTWFGFAQAILHQEALSIPVVPIRGDEYSGKAKRPRNSLLDNTKFKKAFGVSLADWENQLERLMAEVRR
jgi:dTDP-4-dehydrorhamnose reductase